jgi:hypothetical protein
MNYTIGTTFELLSVIVDLLRNFYKYVHNKNGKFYTK